ncbi:MAG: right-handed parallel beta-helix repeat-containing protein [Candidatus Korarchaeum sp.]|nr:right-handed parallel beta-helix repeat-containing protein [Candidatus Korarchaeum sp.]
MFEDRFPLASKGHEDRSLPGVYVYAFRDDGDGNLDPLNDVLTTWGRSRADGSYELSLMPGRYLLVVNSRALMPESLNPGRSLEETWAEQTYQVEWNGSAYVGTGKFGGLNPSVSDSCPLEVVFQDDFETWSGWISYGVGGVRQSNLEFYNGSYSLQKHTGNDPNGGYKSLGKIIGRGYLLQGYAFRPTPIGPRSRVAVSLVDGSYNGYGFIVDHRANTVSIVRRTGGAYVAISQVSYNPPDATWYFWRLILLANNTIILRLYDAEGSSLVQVRATDTTYSSFDRVLVQGDATYYLDTLVLWRLPTRCEHVAKVNTGNYLGESMDFGFSYEVIVNTRDFDDAPTELRFAQGSFRQFIVNSNAITGIQTSYFRVPETDSGYIKQDTPRGTIDVWRIKLSSSLPQVTDSVNLTARTQPGRRSLIEGSYVGCDRYRIPDFETPRVEIDGSGYTVFNLSARYAQLEGFSVYATPYAVVALGSDNRYLIRENFVGTYANGKEAFKVFFGISIGKQGPPVIYKNLSAVIKHNIIARALHYGIVVNSGNLANVTIEENWVRGCGTEYSVGDGISLQTNGNLLLHNLIEGNGNNGDTSVIDGGAGIELMVQVKEQSSGMNRLLYNSILNNLRWGVSALSTYTKANLTGNVISRNGIGVVVAETSVVSMTRNCIYNNSRVGIDLDASGNPNGDDVTLNDGLLNGSEPNKGIDYPVITSALLLDDQLQVEGFIGDESLGGSPRFAGATVEVYLVRNSTKGDNLIGNNLSLKGELPRSYGEGWTYLGRLIADSNGKFSGTLDVSDKGVDPNSLITGTSTLNGTSEFGPNAPVNHERKLSASLRVDGMEAIINVTAHDHDQRNALVYWRKPGNIVVTSMGGDYDHWGTIGDVYWWGFNRIGAGETKRVLLTFSSSGEYSLLDAFMLGLDPPSSLNIEFREFSTITFYPNGSYKVSRLWGFLTLNNTSPDPLSSVELHLDAPGYTFYLDYPTPSEEPDELPLNYSHLAPLSYVRWRYEAPTSEAMVPLEVRERNLSCGVEVTLIARDEVNDIRIRKLGEIWEIGDMRKGESRSRRFSVSGCVSEVASVEFRYANASLITKLRNLKGVSNAEVSVYKELVGNTARTKATFRNGASEFVYNLTGICIMRSPGGAILYCESPNVILRPGEVYETSYFSEVVDRIPFYYVNASFTVVPSVAGSTVPLQSLASGLHLATASLPETVCCIVTSPAVTQTEIARPTEPTAPTTPLTATQTAPTMRTEAQTTATTTTVPTTAVPTTTSPIAKPPIPPINITIPPEVRRLPLPFAMSISLPLLITLLLFRRRTNLIVVDYRTLKILHEAGRLQDLARLFRVAITDLTLLRSFGDEELLRAIVSLGPNIHTVESRDLDLLLRITPSSLDLDTLLAKWLARRLNADFLPEMLLGR